MYVLAFARIAPDATAAGSPLEQIWNAASRLGIGAPTPKYGRVSTDLPSPLPITDEWFRPIAAKESKLTGSEAVAFVAHDVVATIVRNRPTTSGRSAVSVWQQLAEEWRHVHGDGGMQGLLGFVHVFTGVSDDDALTVATKADTAVRQVLRRGGFGNLELTCVVEPGLALWELELPGGRAVAALAGAGNADAVSSWCWTTAGGEGAGHILRYFMHAAKLRYEVGVFQDGMADIREQERQLDVRLTELFRLHEKFESSNVVAREIIDAQSQLGRAQGDASGLLISITHLKDLRQTVAIAAHNVKAYAPTLMPGTGSGHSPHERELALADWIDQRVEHEMSYLNSCRERVSEAQSLTDLRLKQLAAAHARTANWLTVLQTSLLGSLLGAFAVASAIGDPISAPPSVRAAVMVLVAAMALILPSLALRWTHGYGVPELLGLAIVGGSIGWAATKIAEDQTPSAILLGVTAGTAAVLALIGLWANGRRSSRRLRRLDSSFLSAR